MEKTKKRCNEIGCVGFKFKDDERCLSCIRRKYESVWYRPIGSFNTGRNNVTTLDTIDEASV